MVKAPNLNPHKSRLRTSETGWPRRLEKRVRQGGSTNCNYNVRERTWQKTNPGSRKVLQMMRWHQKGSQTMGGGDE